MVNIPILITTLCRYEHFCRCIESLKCNSYAKDTDLYIGLDYPLKEIHWEGYQKICAYLDEGINGFKDVHIIKWETNLGSAENYCRMRAKIYEKYDSFIYSEDDNEFSSNYLEYMNKAMGMFENSNSVIAVSGYMYPINLVDITGNAVLLNTYFSAFGKGVYRKTEELFADEINMDTFVKMYRNVKQMRKLRKVSVNQFCNFVKGMVEYTPDLVKNGEVRKVDLSYGLYMFFHDYKMVFPQISKVRNWGYDGSGINCDLQIEAGIDFEEMPYYRNYNFATQEIDMNSSFDKICIALEGDDNALDDKLNRFFKIPKKEEHITVITYYCSLIIGPRRMAESIKWMKKYKK